MFSNCKNNNITHMMVPPPPPPPPPPPQAAAAAADVIHSGNFGGLLHQIQELGSGPNYWPAANAPPLVLLESAAAGGMAVGGGEDDGHYHPFATVGRKRPAAKTDRHSKIYTSQGPRDRRVRLSIGIARKFFDLQEMLGFDKPSKTLDWLLTESKSAITELVQAKQNDAITGAASEADNINAAGKSRLGQQDTKGKSVDKHRDGSSSSAPKDNKDQTNLSAKESRVKARARARARTREKMLNQIVNTRDSNCCGDLNPNFPFQIQYMNNQIQEVCRISDGPANCNHNSIISSSSTSLSSSSSSSPIFSRKIMTVKHHPTIWGFQQNLGISRDLNLMGGQNVNNNNWDVTSFASTSQPLYGMLDHPKFINSSNSNR